jgi:predicted PurR-regulated permease PerM
MPVLSEILKSLGTYLKAQIRIATIVTGLYIIALAVTGVPWWLLTGLACGVLNILPHLGPVLALGLALFAKWCVTDDLLPLAYVMGAWVAIQIVDGFVLSPRAAGRAGVNPFLSILITLAGAVFFGPIGMLLAVPVTIVVLIVVRATRGQSRIAP